MRPSDPRPHNRLSRFGMIWQVTDGIRLYYLVSVLASACSIVLNFLMPQIISFTVDSVIGSEPIHVPAIAQTLVQSLGGRELLRQHLIICAAAIALCAAASGLFNFFSKITISRGTEGFVKRMRDTLFAHILRLPFAWHTQNQTGDIIQRCTSDVETVRNFVSAQLIEVIRILVLITSALWLMFSMNVTLALVCLATIPIIVCYSTLFHKRIMREFRKADESEGALMVDVQENLTGVRVVRAFGREEYERSKFRRCNDSLAKDWIDLGYTLGFFWGIGDAASCFQLMSIIVVGALLCAKGRMSVGQYIAFISYTQYIAGPVRNLGRTLSDMSKATVSVDRLLEILNVGEEAYSDGSAQCPDGDITFEHVSFSYGSFPVLEDVSFVIPRGSTFGILGGTGSGKSSLTHLLNRLYELPEGSGRVTIGGTDVRDIQLPALRRNVGLVLQEPFLFSKTVYENIGIAVETPEAEAVSQAAQVASVDADIRAFTNGYETIVGERGVTLSGGQKQRIAIARTLLQAPRVMVFDDSMSAVDMETDARIRDALRSGAGDSTLILISHRINTLMQADCILVLDSGRVADIGTHAELIARPGIYRRVYQMQSDAGLIGGEAHG